MTAPTAITPPRSIVLETCALLLAIVSIAFLVSRFDAHKADAAALAKAEAAAYKASVAVNLRRNQANAALDSLAKVRLRTDQTFPAARHTVTQTGASAITTLSTGVGAFVDGNSHPIVGGIPAPTDSLLPLPLARVQIGLVVDSANAAISRVETAMLRERRQAQAAIDRLEATITAQDSLTAALRAEVVAVKAMRPPWYRRAVTGVVGLTIGTSCGAAGWVFGGPVAAIGSAVVCSAVAGIVR